MTTTINFAKIINAGHKIIEHVHVTPVIKSQFINNLIGRNAFFKCENLQKTGSFKIRGALYNILCKHEQGTLKGVLTLSCGYHGKAVAFIANSLHIPAIVVVPRYTPSHICDAIKEYNGRLVVCDDSLNKRMEKLTRMAEEHDYEIIHSYDDYDTIAGQGTVGLEFLAQVLPLDAVLTSITGGSLSAGLAIAMKSLNPNIKVYCVEPEGKELGKSLIAGKRLWKGEPQFQDNIGKGMKAQQPGKLTFPILCEAVEKEVLTVDDEDMLAGMELSYKHLSQVIEPSAGACVQALIKYNDRIPESCRNIGVVLCAGDFEVDGLEKEG